MLLKNWLNSGFKLHGNVQKLQSLRHLPRHLKQPMELLDQNSVLLKRHRAQLRQFLSNAHNNLKCRHSNNAHQLCRPRGHSWVLECRHAQPRHNISHANPWRRLRQIISQAIMPIRVIAQLIRQLVILHLRNIKLGRVMRHRRRAKVMLRNHACKFPPVKVKIMAMVMKVSVGPHVWEHLTPAPAVVQRCKPTQMANKMIFLSKLQYALNAALRLAIINKLTVKLNLVMKMKFRVREVLAFC